MGSLLTMLGTQTHMVDLYIGEMFYRFQLSSILVNYYGVDLRSYVAHNKDRQGTPLWMSWVRLMMVMLLSPYNSVQGMLWSNQVVRGDRSDTDKSFRWDNIRLNLPGEQIYSPKIPWMSKVHGGLKSWPNTLPPMWMNPEWRQGHQKRRGEKPGEWGQFDNAWDYNMIKGRLEWTGKTQVCGQG